MICSFSLSNQKLHGIPDVPEYVVLEIANFMGVESHKELKCTNFSILRV